MSKKNSRSSNRHRTRRGAKSKPKKRPRPKRFALRVGAGTAEEVDKAYGLLSELSQRLKLRFPSWAEARAGKFLVTAIGTTRDTVIEMPGMMGPAEQQPAAPQARAYGIGVPKQFVIRRQGLPALWITGKELPGRPRGSRRPKQERWEKLSLPADLYLKLEKWGLTRKQIPAYSFRMEGRKLTDIARELRITKQAAGRLIKRAITKLNSNTSIKERKEFWRTLYAGHGIKPMPAGLVKDERSGIPYNVNPYKQVLEREDEPDKSY